MSVVGAYIVPHPPIILPEVGCGKEQEIQNTIDAYREISRRAASLKPDTIVLASPHSTQYADYFHISPGRSAKGDLGQFGATGVTAAAVYDAEFAAELSQRAEETGLPAGTLGEKDRSLDHATIIPLRFLNQACSGYRLVRIGLSGLGPLEHYRLGKCIAKSAEKLERRVVLIASGDLSHKLKADGPYGLAPEGPEFDRQVTEAMAEGDFLRFLTFDGDFCDRAAECGLGSFQIMAGALDGLAVKSELLSYEGPFGVGYGIAAFEPSGAEDARRFDLVYIRQEQEKRDERRAGEDAFVRLARLGLETFLRTGSPSPLPDNLPGELTGCRAGVFVSLKKHGRLRGCIGTIAPVTGSIGEEILRNAVSAGTEDPRFSPVRPDELDSLVYSVDVLGEAEPVASEAGLDALRYGVIVTSGQRHGLLLPNLEGVDTAEQQLAIARQKAGIRPDEPCRLERFKVVRHK